MLSTPLPNSESPVASVNERTNVLCCLRVVCVIAGTAGFVAHDSPSLPISRS